MFCVTHSSSRLPGGESRGILAHWSAARLGRALHALAPSIVALLIAATLGLLSPLSCVIHCAIHGHAGEPAHHTHTAGHRDHTAADAPASEYGAPVGRPDPGVEEPVTPPTPRALYELLSLAVAPLSGAGRLIGRLDSRPLRRPRPLPADPSTPPPRLA